MAILVLSPDGKLIDTQATLAANSTAGQSVDKTLVVTSGISTNNATIPDTVALRIENGGSITINSGQTLTINGPFAGQGEVFLGTGTVVFGAGSVEKVDPAWAHAGVTMTPPSALKAGQFISASGKKYQIVACVLRQTTADSGWFAIDDADHAPVGLDPTTPVEELTDMIQLNFNFTALKAGTLVITPDEGYAATELRFGASVGLSNAFIKFFSNLNLRFSGTSAAYGNYHDPGVDVTVTFDAAAGTATVTHPSMSHYDTGGYPPALSIDGPAGNANISVSSVGKTGFIANYLEMIAGKVSVTTVTTENAGTTTAVWDGTDTLTITHPATTNPNDAQVTSSYAPYVPVITDCTATTIVLKFMIANTGAYYTGATCPAILRYARSSMTRSTISGSTKVQVSRGPVQVKSSKVCAATGNLWVYGLFEVA